MLDAMHLVLISGLSGSGKSIALKVLEDADYYCVDNLPSQLLQPLVGQLDLQGYDKVGVVIDIRGGDSVAMLPLQLDALRTNDLRLQFLFLDAQDATLIKRYSETRRRHPLASDRLTLTEAIAEERRRLGELVHLGHHIDTSGIKPNVLREWVRQFVRLDQNPDPCQGLTLLFESFGFKNGLPLDADLVFDVRCLPNPHYDPGLRPMTGCDQPVVEFLEAESEVLRMRADICAFVRAWLPAYVQDSRSYLTVAIGCTGGQHRSVYFAEWLARQFHDCARVLIRHRDMRADPALSGSAA
ncbi:RNase adapter RapZ [Accumulibacter sp.]|uniref:RNase adapter RapZ n=1 Tax=Accumulibacter sp. TaxID=2053492 RepID=UPI0025D71D8B|nr:RNase adapter RapZ [Accumulibacter sp.]MCM8595677.1 RNase adapter RapZ [Accumulibacter sp.]MCM8627763.1 RNase adapter RapZ [Accumulibacter sp.]MDS4049824.1 RNase adapter RapZ [Accumulibacter sp.]